MIDEDSPAFPDSWLAVLRPRRGGVRAPEIEPRADAAEWVRAACAEHRPGIEASLAHPDSDPALVAALRRHLDGAADPLGAAVLALSLRDRGRRLDEWDWERIVDWWVAGHGLPFAAHACAETFRVWGARDVDRVLALRFTAPDDEISPFWGLEHGAVRVRALLAAAGDEEHRRAVERLARCREHRVQRIAVSFLVPDRQDWVDECCTAPPHDPMLTELLWCSLGSSAQLAALGSWARPGWRECEPRTLVTIADGLGPAAVPVLAAAADRPPAPDLRREILAVLAALPCDEAIEALLERLDLPYAYGALREAARRHPVRAMRLLAPRAVGAVEDILLACLRERPRLLATALPGMPEDARTALEALAARLERLPEAPVEELPPVLADPPWRSGGRGGTRGTPAIKGLEPPVERHVVWKPGERAAWHITGGTNLDLRAVAPDRPLEGDRKQPITPTRLLLCPTDLAGPALRDWAPVDAWPFSDWAKSLVARFETDALPIAMSVVELNVRFLDTLLPLRNVDVARLMAGRLAGGWKSRRTVLDWFARHGTDVVPLLVPDALGGTGDRHRRPAEIALRLLASRHGTDEVVRAARAHGDEAAEAVRALLDIDPLKARKAKPPKIGDWADPALLPQVLLRGRSRALPEPAVRDLVAMLAMGRPGTPYPGVAQVGEACDPGSLAEFGWALFRRWETAEVMPVKDRPSQQSAKWGLYQLAWTGDDETTRRLAMVVRRWSQEGERTLVMDGLDVLAELGTAEALDRLRLLERELRHVAFRRAAGERVAEVAERLGVTLEQVGEPPPPDFGLAADGTLTLDYGPRRFTVVFDAQLVSHVVDEAGRRRKTLPKPAADDDPEPAAEAGRRLSELRKETAKFVAAQTGRLERAMRTGHRWSVAEFEAFVRHPLLWHIVRRLVWVAEPSGGGPVAFRLAEDRTLADVADEPYVLPPGARVGVSHPVELGPSLKAWRETFEDYQILQPFPQLHRAVHTLSDTERATGVLDRSRLGPAPKVNEHKLYARGWTKNHGTQDTVLRHLPGGHLLVLHLIDLNARHVDLNPHPIRGIEPGFGPIDPLTETLVLEDLIEATAADD
ncbi:DUF4132 domain-containing protein [Thermomonospora amylolytica]|uniref:DUF4132 domain-containing protein n=1 Tax=Thermomonospora amylolytica TaxID=1411117 RepID=UPI000E6D2DCC|nr:DUF4132 domain-containing protein [Thermomonospora amylolytica]